MAQKDYYGDVNIEGGNMYSGGNKKATNVINNGLVPVLNTAPSASKTKSSGATAGKSVATAAPTPVMTMSEYQRQNMLNQFNNYYNTASTPRAAAPAVTDATVTPTTQTTTTQPTEMTEEEKAAELESRTFGLPVSGGGAAPQWTDVETPVRGPQSSFTGRDMDSALQSLENQFNRNMGTYRPKTEQEIQEQARSDYQSYYDQLRRAAMNEYSMNDLALAQQRAGLQSSYDKSREASARQYRQAYSNADRSLLNRGMQRSSYAAQTLANVAQQGAEAQQAIWDAQVAAEGNIDAQRRQLAGNLASTMMGYDAGQASDVMSRVWGLRDTEYDRQVNRANTLNSLANQLYGYLSQNNEYSRNQWNTENTMRENQHQFDVGVAQARQGVLDNRSQYNANLAEEQRQYNNSANMSELQFRNQYPDYGFTRAEDGRIVRTTPARSSYLGSASDSTQQQYIATLEQALEDQNKNMKKLAYSSSQDDARAQAQLIQWTLEHASNSKKASNTAGTTSAASTANSGTRGQTQNVLPSGGNTSAAGLMETWYPGRDLQYIGK